MGDSPQPHSLATRALRWLAHPVSLGAIAVMVVNDHVLKQEFGTWWTGKLSDIAGLVFFPAVVAVGLAVVAPARYRAADASRLVAIATAVTGVGFVWVKATVGGGATASAVLTAIAGPSVVRYDVTDLLALPALGLAAWVGLGAMRAGAADAGRGEVGTGRARKALTVAALPIALLASVATGEPDDDRAAIVATEDGQWYAAVTGRFRGDEYYEYTADGWERVVQEVEGDPTATWTPPPIDQDQDCVPSDRNVCFRALEGATGVEISADGGDTWSVDWQLSRAQERTLASAYNLPAEEVHTRGVGVAGTRGGYVVIAGNGSDGFAVRGVDGEWKRIGFTEFPCCSMTETVDFATVGDLPHVHAYPVRYAMGLGLAFLALPFLALALRRGRFTPFPVGVRIGAALAYVVGAGLTWAIFAANSSYGVLDRQGQGVGIDAYLWIPGVVAAIAAILAGVAIYGLLRRGAVLATLAGWVLGAVAAGFAAEVAPDGLWWELACGVVALAGSYAVFVPFARRRWVGRAVPTPPVPTPPVPPPPVPPPPVPPLWPPASGS